MERTLIAKTVDHVGKDVAISGWVNTIRSHGRIVFLDIRDRSGVVQTVGTKDVIKDVGTEDVVAIHGLVKKRPEKMINSKLLTGTIEIEVKDITIINKSDELPIPIDTDGYDIDEEIRLKYRYLDLRRERLQKNIRLRSRFIQNVRNFLFTKDFVEIETPLLTKSTPEGSRDFVVPSRLQQGKFYALPQSPQQYKQLLMTAGFERYFQIARAIRDEDLRADRGFEHTQIDLEMSFVQREDVMRMVEDMMTTVVEKMGYTIKEKPFPVFSYKDAIKQFGSDKFDLRTEDDKKKGVLAYAWVVDFPFFEKAKDGSWTFTHNPFSSPIEKHIPWLLQGDRIDEILTSQYDLVCNGFEAGGGSIRSHKPELLKAVFTVMGYSKERIDNEFGHMLKAFKFGTPPHGGIALGVERNVMNLAHEKYLREVVAFPISSGGKTAVMDAPSELSGDQLKELGISISTHGKK